MRTLLAALVLAPWLAAQGVQGGDLILADDGTDSVYRITPTGGVVPLHQGAPLGTPTGVAVNGNLDVFVSDFSANAIYRIPRGGTLTGFATGVAGAIRICADRDGSILVASLTQAALRRVDVNGVVTTIAQGPPLVRPYDVLVDVDGSYVVVDEGNTSSQTTRALYRVTRGGQVTPIWQGAPLRLPHGVALLADGDYAVVDGIVDCVFRVPRTAGTPTILVQTPSIINPDSICEDFEGRVVVAQELASLRRVDLVDRNGGVTSILNPAPFTNLEAIVRAPRLRGPGSVGAGQTATFALEFAGEGVTPYAMWATLSVFPGLPFPAPDTRAIFGNADVLLGATIGANNPVFVGWGGVLLPDGSAAPRLVVPNVSLQPFTMHIQAATIDPLRLTGIRSLANLHVLRL